MKFERHQYWKHSNCIDSFIHVVYVLWDNNLEAEVTVEWITQGIEKCWVAPINGQYAENQITKVYINAEEYDKWKPYNPVGTVF